MGHIGSTHCRATSKATVHKAARGGPTTAPTSTLHLLLFLLFAWDGRLRQRHLTVVNEAHEGKHGLHPERHRLVERDADGIDDLTAALHEHLEELPEEQRPMLWALRMVDSDL